ncbi:MAG: S49 family peptidase [Phycisphaerales bacterium]|nr:S49 family peptidase [Phycisphaerales bacterium]
MRYEQILKAISETCWMIHRPKLEEIIGVVEARAKGVTLETDRFAAIEARRKSHLGTQGRVHVMGLHGTISQRPSLFSVSGGTSTEEFGRELDAALRDPDIGAVLIDADSPGGSVFGVHELSQKIFAARGTKPIAAVANPEAYSAAYYVASSADELWVTPTGMVGSVGVVATHIDYSQANAEDGVKVTYVTAGRHKVEGNPDEPLGDEAKAELQRHVDRYYKMFVESVARNRKTSVERVEADFGQGRIVGAESAVARNMADHIGTLSEAVTALNARVQTGRGTRMERRKLAVAGARR